MNIWSPNSDLENCHREGTEAISPFSMRLPGTFQVLACLPQAGNDGMRKGFRSLNRILGGADSGQGQKNFAINYPRNNVVKLLAPGGGVFCSIIVKGSRAI
jgi:hypothetical protein